MSFLRLEDLFVAGVLAIVTGISAWAMVGADDASPLVSSTAVVMERSSVADETEPAAPAAPRSAPDQLQVATHHSPVCPCCGRLASETSEPRIAHTPHTRTDVARPRAILPPRPTFVN